MGFVFVVTPGDVLLGLFLGFCTLLFVIALVLFGKKPPTPPFGR